MAFSCRERATTSLQNTNDLAREAVSCNAGLGGALVRYRLPIAQTNCSLAVYHVRVCSRNAAGRTAGEALCLSGGCARVGALSGRRTAARAGSKGAFRVGAPPATFGLAAAFWRAARYATVPARSRCACPATSDRPAKRDSVIDGQRTARQTRRQYNDRYAAKQTRPAIRCAIGSLRRTAKGDRQYDER